MPINGIIAVTGDTQFIEWFREAVILSLILFYFPIREHITDKKDIIILLICFAIAAFATSLGQFNEYYTGISKGLKYAYQIGKSVRVNQSLFTAASIFGLTFLFYARKFSGNILLIIFSVITILALITSFSRTFWFILALQVVLLFFYIPKVKRKKLLVYFILIPSILLLSIGIIFKDNTRIALKVMELRLTSSSKGLGDISIQSRLSEYESVLNK